MRMSASEEEEDSSMTMAGLVLGIPVDENRHSVGM